MSKLAYFNNKDYFIGLNEELKLHHIYDSLEVLEEIKEELEDFLLKKSLNLLNRDLTVAFFDVTTIYFESKREDVDEIIEYKDILKSLKYTDKKPTNYRLDVIKIDNLQTMLIKEKKVTIKGLRKFGLSKDFKINETQIVLSLLIDKDGIPITFEIYEGNRAETTTLIDTLDKLKKRFDLKKITIVADRGISRWLNLEEIKQRGYEYIVAIRFKNQKELEEKILNKDNYNTISMSQEGGYYGYNEFTLTQTKKAKKDNQFKKITLTHKIIATYSDKRALKDKKDRDRELAKLYKKLQDGNVVKKSKYLKINNTINDNDNKNNNNDNCNISYEVDLAKVKEDEKYDGFYAIASSDTSINALEAIKIHKNIYEVENSFRDLKSTLNIRPIYHHKKQRIKGHIIVSFLAYFFLKNIEYTLSNSKKFNEYLQKNNETLSLKKIVEAINSVNVVKTDINQKDIFIKLRHNTLASKIIDILKIKTPKNSSRKEEFFNFLQM